MAFFSLLNKTSTFCSSTGWFLKSVVQRDSWTDLREEKVVALHISFGKVLLHIKGSMEEGVEML